MIGHAEGAADPDCSGVTKAETATVCQNFNSAHALWALPAVRDGTATSRRRLRRDMLEDRPLAAIPFGRDRAISNRIAALT